MEFGSDPQSPMETPLHTELPKSDCHDASESRSPSHRPPTANDAGKKDLKIAKDSDSSDVSTKKISLDKHHGLSDDSFLSQNADRTHHWWMPRPASCVVEKTRLCRRKVGSAFVTLSICSALALIHHFHLYRVMESRVLTAEEIAKRKLVMPKEESTTAKEIAKANLVMQKDESTEELDTVHFSCAELVLYDNVVLDKSDENLERNNSEGSDVQPLLRSSGSSKLSKFDRKLYASVRDLCRTKKGQKMLRVTVVPEFVDNYRRIFYESPLPPMPASLSTQESLLLAHKKNSKELPFLQQQRRRRRKYFGEGDDEPAPWIEDAYVTHLAQTDHYDFGRMTNLTAYLAQSINDFSTRPFLLFWFAPKETSWNGVVNIWSSDSHTESTLSQKFGRGVFDDLHSLRIDPMRFPKLVVFKLLRHEDAGSDVGFHFLKLRAMMLSRVKVGSQVDSDTLITPAADLLFSRNRKHFFKDTRVGHPVLPVHWMSRDPEGGDHREFEYKTVHTRTMRWTQAHPTWTYLALPFLGELYFKIVNSDKEDLHRLNFETYDDEAALNVFMWEERITTHWCKFEMYTYAYENFSNRDIKGIVDCCTLADKKWYINGIPIMNFMVHNLKDTEIMHEMLVRIRLDDDKTLPLVYWKGVFYDDLDAVPPENRSCFI